MDEGFEGLLSPTALDALISVEGDEKQLNPEIRNEIKAAKQAVLAAKIDELDTQITEQEKLLPSGVTEFFGKTLPDTIVSGASGALGSILGAKAGGFVGAGIGGQEGADVGQSLMDTVRGLGERTLSPETAPQGGILEDFAKAQASNRRTNILGDPREVDVGSLLEFGLGGLSSVPSKVANKQLASKVGEVAQDIGTPKQVAEIANTAGEQLARGDYTPIATAFGKASTLIDDLNTPLSSGDGNVGDKVAELSQTFFSGMKSYQEAEKKALNLFKELGAERAKLVAGVPTENITSTIVSENPNLFLNIYDQVAAAANKGLVDAKELLPSLDKVLTAATGKGAAPTAEELLTLGQKLKGLGYKTSSDELGKLNVQLFKDAGQSIEAGLKNGIRMSPNGETIMQNWDALTDSMNALKWIENASIGGAREAASIGKSAARGANKASQEGGIGKFFSDAVTALRYRLPPKPTPSDLTAANIQLAQRAPERNLSLLSQSANAMNNPIDTSGLTMSLAETLPLSIAGSEAGSMGGVPGFTSAVIPSLADMVRAGNFGVSDANASNNIDAALNLGMPQSPDQMSLDGGMLAPQQPMFGDPLLEGVNTEDFYADKINIPDALAESAGLDAPQKETPTLERNAASVMDYISKVDPDMSGIPKESLDAAKALLSGSAEDQRAGVYELIKAAPTLFGGSKIPGIDSLVDGVIVDQDERLKAEEMINRALDGDPVRKIEVKDKIRRGEALPSWAYKYMGGEDQKSFEDAFLEKQEGFKPKAYLDTRGNPTIGMGVNLAAFSVSDLRDNGVSENIISKLTPLLGVKGETAKKRLKDFPVSLDENEALELSKAIKQASKTTLEDQYKNETGASLEDLPVQARTVMLSLAYNFGDIKKKLPTFWDYATMGRWDEASDFLEKTVWKQPELTRRRQQEAALLKEIAPDTIQLAANVSYDDDATKGMVDLEDGEKTQTYKF